MPPRTRPDDKADNPPVVPDEVDPVPPEGTEPLLKDSYEYVLLLHGGFTVSRFDTAEQVNAYGVATYGDSSWWAILPVLKRKFPKEEDDG